MSTAIAATAPRSTPIPNTAAPLTIASAPRLIEPTKPCTANPGSGHLGVVVMPWTNLSEASWADTARSVPSRMSNHLELARSSEPVSRDSNAPAPSAENHGVTHEPPAPLDPRFLGHRLLPSTMPTRDRAVLRTRPACAQRLRAREDALVLRPADARRGLGATPFPRLAPIVGRATGGP